VIDSLLLFLNSLQGLPAYALLFGLLVACGIGFPINEDIVLLGAAALTLNGVMDPLWLIVVSWFGLLAGDGLIFHWGHRFGADLLRHRFIARVVHEERLYAMQATILRYGPTYIFVVRFLPGIRTPLFFAAGSLKLPYRYLFIYDGAAALVELPLLVYAVRYVGGRWEEILAVLHQFQTVIVAGVILLVLALWLNRRRQKIKGG
jgi:membrane protein DedA with SNARE-associated domain